MKYIKQINMPPRISVLPALTWWVILDHFNAPGWLYGVVYTGLFILLVAATIRLLKGESVDIFANDKERRP